MVSYLKLFLYLKLWLRRGRSVYNRGSSNYPWISEFVHKYLGYPCWATSWTKTLQLSIELDPSTSRLALVYWLSLSLVLGSSVAQNLILIYIFVIICLVMSHNISYFSFTSFCVQFNGIEFSAHTWAGSSCQQLIIPISTWHVYLLV